MIELVDRVCFCYGIENTIRKIYEYFINSKAGFSNRNSSEVRETHTTILFGRKRYKVLTM